jgi:hypothetical protein
MDFEASDQFREGLEQMAAELRESLSDTAESPAPVALDTSIGRLSRTDE